MPTLETKGGTLSNFGKIIRNTPQGPLLKTQFSYKKIHAQQSALNPGYCSQG